MDVEGNAVLPFVMVEPFSEAMVVREALLRARLGLSSCAMGSL